MRLGWQKRIKNQKAGIKEKWKSKSRFTFLTFAFSLFLWKDSIEDPNAMHAY